MENTKRGGAPPPATLDPGDRTAERLLNHAVAPGKLIVNPITAARLLHVPNVRRVVLDQELWERLHESAEPSLRPSLLVAFETGMRNDESLVARRWACVQPG